MAVIKRCLYYRSGRKAGFHCTKKYSAQNKKIRILALHVMLGSFFFRRSYLFLLQEIQYFLLSTLKIPKNY